LISLPARYGLEVITCIVPVLYQFQYQGYRYACPIPARTYQAGMTWGKTSLILKPWLMKDMGYKFPSLLGRESSLGLFVAKFCVAHTSCKEI